MAKKRLGNANVFTGEDVTPSSSFEEADALLYGEIATIDSSRHTTKPLDIFAIYPNPTQPRRTIPFAIHKHWSGSPDTVAGMFENWFELAETELGSPIDLEAYLVGHETERTASEEHREPGPIEGALRKVLELAASIYHDGLTNAITVAQHDQHYWLETGERRWLSFHLLNLYFQEDKWKRIPARVVNQVDVWRQASENNARDDLNAISKARQFALLLMDLHAQQGKLFRSFAEMVMPGSSDQPYYAQVANSEQWRIPRGKGELLINAMGISHRTQLTHYRNLLNLPPEVWQIADDLDWAEFKIRELVTKAVDTHDLLKLTCLQAKREGYMFTAVNISPDDFITNIPNYPPTLSGEVPPLEEIPLSTPQDRKRIKKLISLTSGVGRYEDKSKKQLLQEISSTRKWLDSLERTIRDSLK